MKRGDHGFAARRKPRRMCGFGQPHGGRQAGFSLLETSWAAAVVGVTVVALYSTFTTGFSIVQESRADLRATQILVDKMEGLRTYTWEQLANTNLVPRTFATQYSPNDPNPGWTYSGSLTVEPAPVTEAYSNELRQVTVSIQWNLGKSTRAKSLKTLVSRHGINNYIL